MAHSPIDTGVPFKGHLASDVRPRKARRLYETCDGRVSLAGVVQMPKRARNYEQTMLERLSDRDYALDYLNAATCGRRRGPNRQLPGGAPTRRKGPGPHHHPTRPRRRPRSAGPLPLPLQARQPRARNLDPCPPRARLPPRGRGRRIADAQRDTMGLVAVFSVRLLSPLLSWSSS